MQFQPEQRNSIDKSSAHLVGIVDNNEDAGNCYFPVIMFVETSFLKLALIEIIQDCNFRSEIISLPGDPLRIIATKSAYVSSQRMLEKCIYIHIDILRPYVAISITTTTNHCNIVQSSQ